MARPRTQNFNLPPNVHHKHGAYYFVRAGKWERPCTTLAAALAAYGRRLDSAYSFAIELGVATANPVRDTKKVPIPKRKRYLENEGIEKIAASGPPAVRAVVNPACVTGQRISDVLDLEIEQSAGKFVCLIQRKTGHRMKLRRTKDLSAVIAQAKATCSALLLTAHKNAKPKTIIFNRRGAPYTYDGFSTIWQRARVASGVLDARIHDVRAKALTDAEELGVDAQPLAGHASRATTEIYLRGRRAFIADPLPSLPPARTAARKKARSVRAASADANHESPGCVRADIVLTNPAD
jgi:integrase